MADTFTFLGMHFVFSTKNRIPLIDDIIRERLHAYIGGIIREIGGTLVEINAMPEHIHFYAYVPKTISVAKFMEIVKANSSKWVHDTLPHKNNFGWQDGYGAFSVSKSSEDAIIQYIRSQQEHHRKKSFQEEFIDFLNKYGIEYDENYIWK
ncbi:MAG: IS200/IS605 family transposase [Candidatus Brocadiales bacterium]|nr:IS200/IS605 family transposase [Candidatus Brocadiales bacterium]